jgi:hypothetical protein
MLLKVRVNGVLETGDEIDEDEFARIFSDVDEDLTGLPIPHYEVVDVRKFFEVYDFDDSEEDAIREKSLDDRLFVYQDGGVLWEDGDILFEPGGEFLDIDSFRSEAERSGAELVE